MWNNLIWIKYATLSASARSETISPIVKFRNDRSVPAETDQNSSNCTGDRWQVQFNLYLEKSNAPTGTSREQIMLNQRRFNVETFKSTFTQHSFKVVRYRGGLDGEMVVAERLQALKIFHFFGEKKNVIQTYQNS